MSTFCKPSQGCKFVMKLHLVKFQVYQITITLVLGDLLQNIQLEDREGEVGWKKISHQQEYNPSRNKSLLY